MKSLKTKSHRHSTPKAGVLFSGGKDSVYAFHLAKLSAFDVKCLIKLIPSSNESMMFHYPFTKGIDFEKILGLPLIEVLVNEDDELDKLKEALSKAKIQYDINYVFTGAMDSEYQRMRFNFVCEELGLKTISPLWRKDQKKMIREQVDVFSVQVVSITALGLNKELLIKPLDETALNKIYQSKTVTNKAFEGGEAETLVLDAPEFKYRVLLKDKTISSESEYQHYLKAKLKLMKK